MKPGNSLAQAAAAKLIAHQTRHASSAVVPLRSTVDAVNLAALELSHWVGADGCSALLARAVRAAADVHPVLRGISVVSNSAPALSGVDEIVAANDASTVAVALNATLEELFDLLVRVVGEDLTMKLAEQMMSSATTDDAQEKGKEAGM